MIKHKNESHFIALGYGDLSFWCYKCDSYLHHLRMEKVFNVYSKFHIVKFGVETKAQLFCDVNEINLESLSLDDEKNNTFTGRSYKTGIVYDSRYELHIGLVGHPERPARTRSIISKLRSEGILDRCIRIPAREATNEEILSTHSENLVKKINATKNRNYSESPFFIDSDTFCSEHSSETARLAAGGLIDLCDKVLSGEIDDGMAFIRPPGHHADQSRAMGFCIFNNIAICANVIRKKYTLSRIAIID